MNDPADFDSMSPGEMAIWAAAYMHVYDRYRGEPQHAISYATGFVIELRELYATGDMPSATCAAAVRAMLDKGRPTFTAD